MTQTQTPLAASSTSGFFQALPVLPPQYTCTEELPQRARDFYTSDSDASDDKIIARVLNLYLPPNTSDVTHHVHRLARIALAPSVLKHATDAETNHPVLQPLTTFGQENKHDPLWTTTGWQKLKEIGFEQGVVAVAFDETKTTFNRRIHEFALSHFWGPTGTMTSCPMAMTDGAATLLNKHLHDADGEQPGRASVFKEAYTRLTSRDIKLAWTSGQWMTERSGGSDVSGTETVATHMSAHELELEAKDGREFDAAGMPLGSWKLDGFKWFSSATDSDMAVLLARTAGGRLSAFYMPLRRRVSNTASEIDVFDDEVSSLTELNGIRIQRLKNKLGTKSLPTAELELRGARAWLLGTEGQGVKDISTVLNTTRLHTAAGSVANWARGLAICRAYSKVRKVRGGLLQDNPAHLRWMADETVKYWAAAHFVFLGVGLQGALEQDWDDMVATTRAAKLIPKDNMQIAALLRLVLPVMKAQVSVASVSGLRQCMECLGGVGYCENNEDGGLMNIAKTFRDNLVNPIWEGTVSVMAEDVVRVLFGNANILSNIFEPWVRNVLRASSSVFASEVAAVEDRLCALSMIVLRSSKDKEKLLYRGREILDHIDMVVTGAVLIYDASVDMDPVAREVAKRWFQSKVPALHTDIWELSSKLDRQIFLGSSPSGTLSRL